MIEMGAKNRLVLLFWLSWKWVQFIIITYKLYQAINYLRGPSQSEVLVAAAIVAIISDG